MTRDGREMEIVSFESAEAFESWLSDQHATSAGIWLKLRKKGAGIVALDYAQALEVALCYGWIDGQKGKFDAQHWLQRFTPRKPNSKWSKINRDKAVALIEQGRMRPAGLAEVERAKTDGRWQAAYDGARTSSVPDDLVAALAAIRLRQSSSRPSTGKIASRSSIASKTSRSPRPGRAESRSMWRCWLRERSSTPERRGRLWVGPRRPAIGPPADHQFGGQTTQGSRPPQLQGSLGSVTHQLNTIRHPSSEPRHRILNDVLRRVMRDSSPPGDVRRGPATVDTDSTTSPSPSDPDRRQVSRSHDAVAVPGRRPASRPAGATPRRGSRRGRCRQGVLRRRYGRAARPSTGEATSRPRSDWGPGRRTSSTRTGRRPGRRPDPQRRTHPSDVRRQVVDPGRRAVIQIAEPREVRCPRLQPADVVTRARHQQLAVVRDGGDKVQRGDHHVADAKPVRKSPGRRCPIEREAHSWRR